MDTAFIVEPDVVNPTATALSLRLVDGSIQDTVLTAPDGSVLTLDTDPLVAAVSDKVYFVGTRNAKEFVYQASVSPSEASGIMITEMDNYFTPTGLGRFMAPVRDGVAWLSFNYLYYRTPQLAVSSRQSRRCVCERERKGERGQVRQVESQCLHSTQLQELYG